VALPVRGNHKVEGISLLTQAHAEIVTRVKTQNAVLSALSGDDAARLAPHLQLVDLTRDQRLKRRGRPTDFVYFIERGVACTTAEDIGVHGVEIGMIGREGYVGVGAVLGATPAAYDVQVLAPGTAHRIVVASLREAMNASATLRHAMLTYVHFFMLQVMREAQTNARATLEERLSRCLLMMHDRVEGDELHLTHDRLATMLGVRRAGVSVAAKKLERNGIIRLHRGAILIQDRNGLEQSSAGAYGALDKRARKTVFEGP
jgi:CRP-like cAMP-binding protein